MWWFKKYPELLSEISEGLSSNSSYIELASNRGNILVSSGEIVVRLDKVIKYPILIAYPHTTPYELPYVFPLTQPLDQDQIDDLSLMDFDLEFDEYIEPFVKFLYQRHQLPNGSLCLLEPDNLDNEGAWLFSVDEVIKRVRDWFAGISTDRHPPEGPEVEMFVHFPNQSSEYEFILPDSFYQNCHEGEGGFYAVNNGGLFNDLYLGFVPYRAPKGIITVPEDFSEEWSFTFDQLEMISTLFDPKQYDQVELMKNNKELIQGYWFYVNSEYSPFKELHGLVEILGEGNMELGYLRLYRSIVRDVQRAKDTIFLATIFPNRKEEDEWQVFVLSKKENAEIYHVFSDLTESEFESRLDSYSFKAVRTKKFTENEFHKRNQGRASREILRDESINIVGCGSLGSEIADSLCKAGVGQITLIDKESLSPENAIRHRCGLEDSGKPKAIALTFRLKQNNPFVNITPFPVSILERNLYGKLPHATMAISTIGDDNVEEYFNEQSVINNQVVFYARALRGGKAARIFRVIPGKDPCMYCLALYRQESHPDFMDIPHDESLPTINNECNNPIRPGSASDLKLIASITSSILIDSLQNGYSEENHWIWSTEEINELQSYQRTSKKLDPHSECRHCRKVHPVNVQIMKSQLEFMISETQKEEKIETGGVLLGEFLGDGFLVHYASGPGPSANKTSVRFEKDIQFCQEFIDRKSIEDPERAFYLGEWHYHPFEDNRPSMTDLRSLDGISRQRDYLTTNPVMIILNNQGKPRTTIHPYDRSFYKVDLETVSDEKN